jgi:hypothetical protein
VVHDCQAAIQPVGSKELAAHLKPWSPQFASLRLAILLAQLNLDSVEPGSITFQPVRRHGLEDEGPELEMGGAVGFARYGRQAGLADQGFGRKNLRDLAQSQPDPRNPPFPPSRRELIVIEADQHHFEGAGVAVAVEVDTGVAIAEQGPVSEPVCAAINDPEAELFEEAERLPYLRRPPVRLWHLKPHPLIQALAARHPVDSVGRRGLEPGTYGLKA